MSRARVTCLRLAFLDPTHDDEAVMNGAPGSCVQSCAEDERFGDEGAAELGAKAPTPMLMWSALGKSQP